VVSIEPEITLPLENVRKGIEDELRLQKYLDAFQELRNKVEDAFAAGQKAEDIAKDNNLKLTSLEPFDKSGQNAKGTLVLQAIPDELRASVLDQAFSLSEDGASPVIDPTAHFAFTVKVNKILPSRVPEQADIKDRLQNDLETVQKREKSLKLASTLATEAKNVQDLARLAKEKGATVLTHPIRVSRIDLDSKDFVKTETGQFFKTLTQETAQQIFSAGINKAVFGLSQDGAVVLMLQSIEKADTDPKVVDNLQKAVESMPQQDLTPTLILVARDQFPTHINEEVLKLINR
jgi:hypothetical protein